MGKKSIKENKTEYQLCREDAEMTRAQAAEALEFISESRIDKIENEKTAPMPEEILAMGRVYKHPELCNYYCSQKCPIGKETVPEIKMKDLSQIVLQMLASLNTIEREKNRLIEITADGRVDDSELKDFAEIQNTIQKIAETADAMNLWIERMIVSGAIDRDKLAKVQEQLRGLQG